MGAVTELRAYFSQATRNQNIIQLEETLTRRFKPRNHMTGLNLKKVNKINLLIMIINCSKESNKVLSTHFT